MEVEIIYKGNIQPENSTPHHLKTYNLSLFDQLNLPVYISLVLFYQAHVTSNTLKLKHSLSKTLSSYYPFAGRIKDSFSIHCNDQGAHYVEARVKNYSLSQFLEHFDGQLIQSLLPTDPFSDQSDGSHVVMIQVSVFQCGGIAISFSGAHKLIDGSTAFNALKSWAGNSNSNSSKEIIPPSFVIPSLFPNDPLLPKDATLSPVFKFIKPVKCITRRFVFDSSAISNLKTKASNSELVKNPSTVEAVTALIWRSALLISREKSNGHQKPSILSLAVDLRRRMDPPLPDNSVGNFLWTATAFCDAKAIIELQNMVGYIREALSKINNKEFVERLQTDFHDSLMKLHEVYSNEEEIDYFSCSSTYKSGIYEVDFGWGTPTWVSAGEINYPQLRNFIFLMETRSGSGIEAWVTLDEEDMARFERDSELLAFAAIDPSPLANFMNKN